MGVGAEIVAQLAMQISIRLGETLTKQSLSTATSCVLKAHEHHDAVDVVLAVRLAPQIQQRPAKLDLF